MKSDGDSRPVCTFHHFLFKKIRISFLVIRFYGTEPSIRFSFKSSIHLHSYYKSANMQCQNNILVYYTLHFRAILCHILYLFLLNTGVEKLSGVTSGLGNGVVGSCAIDMLLVFLIASGSSSGALVFCDDDTTNLFSDIVFNKFLPASLVCKKYIY